MELRPSAEREWVEEVRLAEEGDAVKVEATAGVARRDAEVGMCGSKRVYSTLLSGEKVYSAGYR